MSFNFGNTTAPALGQTSTPAKPPAFGSFSFNAPTTSALPFGSSTTTTSAPAFGATPAFGTTPGFGTTTSAPALGGFGTTTTAPTLGGFGSFGTTTTPSLFSNFGGTSTGFGAGAGTGTTNTSSFGTGLGTTGFGNFGTGGAFGGTTTSMPTLGGFGTNFNLQQPQQFNALQQQQQQQQQQALNPDEVFKQSIFNVSIYRDERDTTLAKWNYLQAMWGHGKAFYSESAPPVEITPQNYLCQFKAMAYSRLPGKENKQGLIALNFNKPFTEVKNNQQQIKGSLWQMFGSKQNLIINIDTIKQIEDKVQVVIFVEERLSQTSNDTKRILATDVSNYLNQPNMKQQLTNIGIEQALALVLPDEDQLKEYLEITPKGIDPRMWRQAKLDNPDPKNLIPIPMIGFHELKWRIKCQENETDTHLQYLAKVEKDITELKQRHAASTARVQEQKRKLAELSHKILKIIVKQECTRKVGVSLSSEEEMLKSKLENMQACLSAPTQFKGRLNELLSRMRMQRNQYSMINSNEYTIDKDSEEEMKSFLTMQQSAIEILIDTVNKDMKVLKIMKDNIIQSMQKQ